MEFLKFSKIYRVSRPCIITEKIDGTNAQIFIGENGEFLCGSRNRWIEPGNDNAGFAKWAHENKAELMKLGTGHHYGEWWGKGIQRGYGQTEKIFSLFNVSKWRDDAIRPMCCRVVPVLYEGIFSTCAIDDCIDKLRADGSVAAHGFDKPEGIVCYHVQGGFSLKKTLENDDEPKSKNIGTLTIT